MSTERRSDAAKLGWKRRRERIKEANAERWKVFCKWCHEKGHDPKSFRASFAYHYREECLPVSYRLNVK